MSLRKLEAAAQDIATETGCPLRVAREMVRILLAAWADHVTGDTKAGDAFLTLFGLPSEEETIR